MATETLPEPSVAPRKPKGSQPSNDQYIDRQIRRTQLQVRIVDIVSSLVVWAAAVLVTLLVLALCDHWFVSIGPVGRWLSLLLLVGGSGYYFAVTLGPLVWRRINGAYAAKVIEDAEPSLKNSLLNFLLLRGNSAGVPDVVVDALRDRAASDLSHAHVEGAVDRTPLIHLGYVLCGVMVIFAGYKFLSPKDPFRTVARVLAPWADIARPSRVQIMNVAPGHADVYQGQVVTITADVDGNSTQDGVELIYTTSDGQTLNAVLPMQAAAGMQYSCQLPPGPSQSGVQQDMVYRVKAGDAESPEFRIHMLPSPRIEVESVELHYPAYTKRPPQTLNRQGDVRAVEGTRAIVHAQANQEIASAYIEFDPATEAGVKRNATLTMQATGTSATGEFRLERLRDGTPRHSTYQVRLLSQANMSNDRPTLHRIEALADLSPEIEVLAPLERRLDLPVDRTLKVELRGRDPDFGLRKITLALTSGEAKLEPVVLHDHKEGQQGPINVAHVISPQKLGLQPGDDLTLVGVAEDNRHDGAGELAANVSRTDRYVIHITAPEARPASSSNEPMDDGEGSDSRPQPKQSGESSDAEDNKPPKPGEKSTKPEDKKNPDAKPEKSEPKEKPESAKPDDKPKPGEKSGSSKPDRSKSGDKTKPEKTEKSKPGEKQNEPESGDKSKEEKKKQNDGGQGGGKSEEKSEGAQESEGSGGESQSGGESSKEDQGEGASGDSSDSESAGQSGTEKPSGSGSQGGGKQQPGSKSDSGSDASESGTDEISGGDASQSGSKSDSGKPGQGGKPAGVQSGEDRPKHDGEVFEKLNEQLKEKQPGEKQQGNKSGQPQGEKSGTPAGEKAEGEKPDGGAGEERLTPTRSGGSGEKSKDPSGAGQGTTSEQSPMPTGLMENGAEQGTQGNQEAGEKPGEKSQSGEPKTGAGKSKPEEGTQPSPEKQPGEKRGEGQAQSETGNQNDEKGTSPGSNKPAKPMTADGAKPEENATSDSPGAGQQGDPGSAQKPNKPNPAGETQKPSQDKQKTPKPDGGENNGDEASASSSDKKQSDSQGETNGENSGGGKQGAGQSGKQQGNDAPGSSTSSDEGAGKSKEEGQGETGTKGGKGPESERPTGKPGSQQGNGSSQKPGENGSKPDASKPGAGEGGKAGKPPMNAESDPSQGRPSGDVARGGGKPSEGEQIEGQTTKPVDIADTEAENLEFAKKSTDLALQYLKDQKDNPDPELLKKLGWSKDDLKSFLNRWESLKNTAKEGPDAKEELNDAYRSLGLRPAAEKRRSAGQGDDSTRGNRDAGARSEPPPGYAEQFKAFRKGAGK